MKKVYKYLCVSLISFMLLLNGVFAAGYSTSVTSNSVTVGGSVTLNIKGSDIAGKFTISSSNNSVVGLSTGSVWIDNNTQSITLKANNVGTSVITIVPADVSSYSGDTITGNKTITITVKAKPVVSNNSGTNNNGGGSSSNGNSYAPKPKSSNSYLSSLTVDGYELDSKFDKETLEYSVVLKEGTEKIKINAQLADSSAKVTGVGEVSVSEGINTFELVVTAENGNVRIYELKIFRGYKFSSDKYIYNEENNYLYTGTDIDNDTILNNISIDSSFTKKIEGNKLIIATSEENLLSINILNVNMTKYNVVDKVITFSSYITLAELRDNLVLSDGLNLKVIIDDEQINNDDDLLLEGMKLKICFDDVVLEQYDINVLSSINTLDGISLSNGTLNEIFDKTNNSYTATVYSDKVTIDVVKTDAKSRVSGDIGEFALNYGINNFEIIVTSENDIENIYELEIFRGYKFSSDKYFYNEEENYLYTGTDIFEEAILNNILLTDDELTPTINDDEQLVISYGDLMLLNINLLNIDFYEYDITDDNVISITEGLMIDDFIRGIIMSNRLSYKLLNNDVELSGDEVLVNDVLLEIYYDELLLDTFNIDVVDFNIDFSNLVDNVELDVDKDKKYINYVTSTIDCGNLGIYKKITKVEELLQRIVLSSSGYAEVYGVDGNKKDLSSVVVTGDKLVIYNYGSKYDEYTISIFGDSYGLGRVSLNDLTAIRKILVKWVVPETGLVFKKEGVYYNALDLDKNGSIGLIDLVKMRKLRAGEFADSGVCPELK